MVQAFPLTIYGTPVAAGKTYSNTAAFDGDGFVDLHHQGDETLYANDDDAASQVSGYGNQRLEGRISGTFSRRPAKIFYWYRRCY
jgi:hypothetical protein